jgi:Domain of unknown function (DUF397)
MPGLTSTNCLQARWVMSSYSLGNGECVQVTSTAHVQVRDSKSPDGPQLSFSPAAWAAFTGSLRQMSLR